MNLNSLRTITWGTVAAAVVSALLLAGVESGLPDGGRASARSGTPRPLPSEPTGAGPQRKPAAEPKVPKTANPEGGRTTP